MYGILPPHLTERLAKTGRASFVKALHHDAGVRHARHALDSDSSAGDIEVFDAHGTFDDAPTIKADDSLPQAVRVKKWAEATATVLKPKDIPDGVVRYGEEYSNAFYDGKHLVFGMGDGEVFKDFTLGLDVFAHEFGHKLIELGPNLEYSGQPGALNESLADVLGVCVRAAHTGEVDWRIGAELFIDGASALRDMKNPGTAYNNELLGKDPQVGHMKDFDPTYLDNGGVHINSGIPNKAFVLFTEGVGMDPQTTPLDLWLAAMAMSGPKTDFSLFAGACVKAAGASEGGSAVEQAMRAAWDGVGVSVATLV